MYGQMYRIMRIPKRKFLASIRTSHKQIRKNLLNVGYRHYRYVCSMMWLTIPSTKRKEVLVLLSFILL
jgi:hypothetical protein